MAKKQTAGKRKAEFTVEERAAMQARAKELKAGARKGSMDGADGVLAKIAGMPEPDRGMAGRLHTIITDAAPTLYPKTWYGMPAYGQDGKVVCFFQPAHKFKARYATLGFSDQAALDDGAMWPTAFALKTLTPREEARIAALVKLAVGR